MKKVKVALPLHIINTNPLTTDIRSMVTDYANAVIGDNIKTDEEKEKAKLHQKACHGVISFHERHPEMPLYAVLSVGVSAGAFKRSEFEKGYKKFDPIKTNAVLLMAKEYNRVMGIKGKPSDTTWRIVNKYYNEVSKDINHFVKALKNAGSLDNKRGHFKEQCHALGM